MYENKQEEKVLQLRILPHYSEDKHIADAINEEAFPECERNSLDDLSDFDKEEFERFTAYLSSIVPDHIPRLYRK